ncbi:hypothetical protein FNV43_RR25334 [Rhamnella rubrinervis]|uniref:Protein MAINTENANCE OF PSII UNDER HIGH LIGHT 1 n=1 Tax=Rhamnella rubrinervis TaxID=2594499 RepID=A0A8K0GR22_9ROSA|nr:hypothetical protein FNV43_RR25334 [Rhamnella rubrinervis]
MASAAQAMIAANTFTCTFLTHTRTSSFKRCHRANHNLLTLRASSEDTDCNVEECAPDKEVGKVSMEWVAGEKTKVVGTFPPRRRGWTGYVEKDTAGQTNIYSVEPSVYVAESAISSGTAGSSADGAENTAAIAAGIALVFVATASAILLQVGKNPPQVQTVQYTGPSLSYYINKFKPQEIIQFSVPSEAESSSLAQPESSDAPSTFQVESQLQFEPSASGPSSVS